MHLTRYFYYKSQFWRGLSLGQSWQRCLRKEYSLTTSVSIRRFPGLGDDILYSTVYNYGLKWRFSRWFDRNFTHPTTSL